VTPAGGLAKARFDKAQEFLIVADTVADSTYNAAVVLAVMAGIAASDAILAHMAGWLPTSRQPHDDAPLRLRKAGYPHAAKQLQRLLAMKNVAQYQARAMSSKESEDAVTRAGRLVESARQLLAVGG
jgi:hypothetical protein